VRERFASVGVTVAAPERRNLEYLATFIPCELKKWAGPIAASGATGLKTRSELEPDSIRRIGGSNAWRPHR
jgi:hypothetical protein